MTTGSEASWFGAPDVLLGELQRHDIVFTRRLEIPGYGDLEEISRGGQGLVYAATQHSTGRRVAIKVLFEDARSLAARRRRFEREIELIGRLQHPHIVRIYDSGITADDRLFIVMEYISGDTLARCLGTSAPSDDDPSGAPDQLLPSDNGDGSADRPAGGASVMQWSLAARLELFGRICDAVQFAHQRAVLHRDLKPGNILIDADDQPHILDFGIARCLDALPLDRGMTASGQFLGTLAYASPEQVVSGAASMDVRSDVYALGVILYELLTGERPYAVGDALGQAVQAVTEAEPTAPSAAPRAEGVGPDLDAVALKALAKEPTERYQSVADLGADVRRARAGEAVEALSHERSYVIRKTVARYRWPLTAAAAAVILLGAFAGTMAVMRDRAQREADKYRRIVQFLDDTFYSLKDSDAGDVTLRELLDDSRHWLYVLDDTPDVKAAVQTSIGNWYRGVGDYAAAEELFAEGLASRRELFGTESLPVAESISSMGLLRKDQARLQDAAQLMREALVIRRAILGDLHATTAINIGNLALVQRDLGELQEADTLLREQLEIRRAVLGEEDPAVALSLYNLADVTRQRAQSAEAESLHRQALAVRETWLDEGHPDIAASRVALADILFDAEQFEEAESLLWTSFESCRTHLDVGHPRRIQSAAALARLLLRTERPGEARAVVMDTLPQDEDASRHTPAALIEILAELDS